MPPRSTSESFWAKVKTSRGGNKCWPWIGYVNNQGYGATIFCGKQMLAHRKAIELAYAITLPSTTCVCHHCDNRLCCNPLHLFLGTRTENNNDRHRKGRSRGASHEGENNPRARLTNMQVRRIFTSKLPPREIAPAYKLSVSQVCDIRARRIWKSATSGLNRGHNGWRTENANARAAERVR